MHCRSDLLLCVRLVCRPADYNITCADPESFARGGPILTTLFFFFFFRRGVRIRIALKEGHHRPASERHLNGDSLAGR